MSRLIWSIWGQFVRHSVIPSVTRFVSAQYLENKLMGFYQILHIRHWYWQDLGWGCYASFVSIRNSYCRWWFLIDARISFRPMSCIIVKRVCVSIPVSCRCTGRSWEGSDGGWSPFVYAFIWSRSMRGLLHINCCKFVTELWPLIDVRISFPLNILTTGRTCNNFKVINAHCDKSKRKNWFSPSFGTRTFSQSHGPWFMSDFCFRSISWERIDGFWQNFADTLISARSRLGSWHVNFLQIFNRIIALDWHQIFVSAQYFEKELMNFDKLFISIYLYLFILSQPCEEDFRTGVQRNRTKKKERIKAR